MDAKQKSEGHLLRKGRFSEVNRCYLVTTVTANRKSIFNDFYAARIVCNTLCHLDQIGRSKTWCFVVMPDHVHWLVSLGATDSLASVMRSMKGFSGMKISRHLQSTDKIWQSGYHDHALRDGEDIREYARYIIMNPVRKGLVTKPSEYSHWDAIWL
jgi:putative transposase